MYNVEKNMALRPIKLTHQLIGLSPWAAKTGRRQSIPQPHLGWGGSLDSPTWD
jgi:hypothetical protein